jgi:hypothetical protein
MEVYVDISLHYFNDKGFLVSAEADALIINRTKKIKMSLDIPSGVLTEFHRDEMEAVIYNKNFDIIKEQALSFVKTTLKEIGVEASYL